MLPLLLAGLAAQTAASSEGLVNSFESAEDVLHLSTLSAQVETSSSGVTEGMHSLRVTYLPSDWPHVLLQPGTPWNWGAVGGLAVDVTNPGKETVTIGIRMDDDPTADGWQHSRTAQIPVAPGKTQTVIAAFGPDPMSVGMRGLPPNPLGASYAANGGGSFDAHHIVGMQIFMHKPGKATTLFFDNVRTVPPISLDGIVDRFGQFAKGEWPGKVHADTDLKADLPREGATPPRAGRDRFGGWLDGPKLKATGFFRTEKVNGRWWLVDPDGRLFFSAGIDTMTPSESTMVTGREYMFSWLPKPNEPLFAFLTPVSNVHSGPVQSGNAMGFYSSNLFRKYGDGWRESWKATALRRLPSWGFNTIGNWADGALWKNGHVPYVATASIGGDHARIKSGSDYWGAMHDPFDPQFAADASRAVADAAKKAKGDPWCLGYFLDNELSWAGDGPNARYGLALGALSSPAGSPAKAAFVSRLRAKYGSIEAFNRAWQTQLANWSGLDAPLSVKGELSEAQKFDCSTFVKTFALKYFQTVREQLRKVDPDHLYLGCRFAWHGPEAEEAAAEVCDVVSYNVYASALDPKEWSGVARLNKPCIIGEFHMGSLDRGMFHPGLVAATSEGARAAMFEGYVRSVLQNPSFVGCHWFQYVDEPLTGRYFDGENYHIGFVSVVDRPYPEMVAAARHVLGSAYETRFGPYKIEEKPKPLRTVRRKGKRGRL